MGSIAFKVVVGVVFCTGLFCLVAFGISESHPSPQEMLYDEALELISAYWEKHRSFPQSLRDLAFTYPGSSKPSDLDELKYESTTGRFRLSVQFPNGRGIATCSGIGGTTPFGCYARDLDPDLNHETSN